MAFEDFDLKDFLRKVAPTVATVLGGPAAGMAVTGLSQILLGKPDGTEAEMAQVIKTGGMTDETIIRLKELDTELKTKEKEIGLSFAELEFKVDAAYLADVQNARQRQVDTKDNMPQIITAVAFGVYVLEFLFFASGQMNNLDEFTKAIITRAFGTVDGILLTCVAYFMGTSKGSKNSGDALRRIAEAPVAPPVVVVPPTKDEPAKVV